MLGLGSDEDYIADAEEVLGALGASWVRNAQGGWDVTYAGKVWHADNAAAFASVAQDVSNEALNPEDIEFNIIVSDLDR
jgi:hypothetical protein